MTRIGQLNASAGIVAITLLCLAWPASVSGQDSKRPADANRGAVIAAQGAGGAPACAQCHAFDGASDSTGAFPRIDGQSASYLEQQMRDFASSERMNAIMSPIAKALSADDTADVAEYYAKRSGQSLSLGANQLGEMALTLYNRARGWRILHRNGKLHGAMSTVTLDPSGLSRTLGRFCGLNCTGTVVARTAMKAGLITLVLLKGFADAAVAGPFDDGQTAYDRGDYATAVRLWRPLADQGDAIAESSLGAMYASGTGVQQDSGVAATWYRRAADQGLVNAQYNLGVLYDRGRGLPRNYSAAVAWFRKAADQGHPDAQYNLGVMYADGRGVPRDFASAEMWYRRAADQGNASAQSSLGALYAFGKGVEQDDVEAVAWFRKAAAQGDAGAQYNLGVMYADGRGVPRDLATAVTWYRKAADQGNAIAQSNLGAMYAEGRGVPQDHVMALMWLSLAAESGNRIAERNRDIAAGHLTSTQIAEAERLVRERNPR